MIYQVALHVALAAFWRRIYRLNRRAVTRELEARRRELEEALEALRTSR